MEKEMKIELLADILDVDPSEISDEMALNEIGVWDSLAVLSFIVMVGEEFKKEVKGEDVKKCVTVADALAIMN